MCSGNLAKRSPSPWPHRFAVETALLARALLRASVSNRVLAQALLVLRACAGLQNRETERVQKKNSGSQTKLNKDNIRKTTNEVV